MREAPLPQPPDELISDPVTLRFSQVLPGDAARGLVPSYHFRIFVREADVGHLNLRLGETDHVRLAAGHVGFEVAPAYRGHHYALQACRALAPFARTIQSELLLTCDPDNHASRRTIELLGAAFIDEVAVPVQDPHDARGSRTKRRYRWTP